MLAGILITIAHYFMYEHGVLHYGSALAMDFYGAAYGFFVNVGIALSVSFLHHEPPSTALDRPPAAARAVPRSWIRTPQALAVAAAALTILLNWIYW